MADCARTRRQTAALSAALLTTLAVTALTPAPAASAASTVAGSRGPARPSTVQDLTPRRAPQLDLRAGHTWDGHTWDGHTWDGHTWDGHTWDGAASPAPDDQDQVTTS